MYKKTESFTDHSKPYITGNGYASYCKHVFNYEGYEKNPNINNNWIYIKTDYISTYFNSCEVPDNCVIFTSNSDYRITNKHLQYLNNNKVKYWFGQNAAITHHKLKSIPIGLANSVWSHGTRERLDIITSIQNTKKETMLYVNFAVATNREERNKCLELTGTTNSYGPMTPVENINNVSKSFFCLSPDGGGGDAHRTWEALYLGCIPIVTKQEVMTHYENLPIIVLNDWKEFKTLNLNESLYNSIWNNFDRSKLYLDNYIQNIKKTYNI